MTLPDLMIIAGALMLFGLAYYWRRRAVLLEIRYGVANDFRQRMSDHNQKLHIRLRRIAEQETPNANATVKRMAKIARGEG